MNQNLKVVIQSDGDRISIKEYDVIKMQGGATYELLCNARIYQNTNLSVNIYKGQIECKVFPW